MNALCSYTAGVFVCPKAEYESPDLHWLNEQADWSEVEIRHALSLVDDWETIVGDDEQALVEKCHRVYWSRRLATWVICLLEGVSVDLERETLGCIEDALKARPITEELLNELLIAPLKQPDRATALAAQALGDGHAAIGAILERLHDLQPLLRRLVDTWLLVPNEYITELVSAQQALWLRVVREGVLIKLLEANTHEALRQSWNLLVFNEKLPAGRNAISQVGNWVAERLFPISSRQRNTAAQSDDEPMPRDGWEDWQTKRRPNPDVHSSVMKQIREIATAVANGRDEKAKKFLGDLIDQQRRCSSREDALKSLCNIAQKCADMFRTDFERLCLDEALQIDPNDTWTLVQWGDHLKRTGDYDTAIEALNKAVSSGGSVVGISSIADVWAERGDYSKAAELYWSIPGWDQIVAVRTALADLLRRRGELVAATKEYQEILKQWPEADRAVAGEAEAAKRMGNLGDAQRLYESLIDSPAIEPHSKLLYRVAMCGILKQTNKLSDAYSMVDGIVREAPFLMRARVERSTILGLLGQEQKAYSWMPKSDLPPGLGAWGRRYYSGLLLLKLKKYELAKNLLKQRFDTSLMSADEKVVLRLGAALAFLHENDMTNASRVLNDVGEATDCYTKYVRDVLQLHLAVVRSDREWIQTIVERLASARNEYKMIDDAVSMLQAGSIREALKLELNLLLTLAA
jgi:tetratricopeptide (TPR) repeat protein